MTTLILVRHGQTEFNLQGIYQGQADSPLTDEGQTQARALAPRIRGLRTHARLYHSDLGRAEHTARLLADPDHHQLVPDPGLRERHYGIFQGVPKAQIPERFPEAWAAYRTGDPDVEIPGGESQRQFLTRVLRTFEALADAHPDDRVVAVSHGGTLGVFIKHVLGLPIDAPRRFDMGNTSLSVIVRGDDGGWQVRTLGELAHLADLPEANQTEG